MLMGITLAGFLVASLISTAVYMISGYILAFGPAFFESVSAFTTTGATVFPFAPYLPNWLKIYRAACQWIGGGGTLIFLALLLSNVDSSDTGFSRSNTADGAIYRAGIRTSSIGKRLILTYVIMTVTEFLLLLVSGASLQDSICLSFSTISTGGFTAGAFINGFSETILVLFMIFTSINYTLYYHALKKHFDKFEKNTELNALLCILIGGAVLVSGSLLISGTYDIRDSIVNGVFQTVSSMSTTGFAVADTPMWPSFTKVILAVLSFIGGSSCSLASGIKILRVVTALKLISKSFTARIHPKAVVSTKINGKSISSEVSGSMGAFVLTYFVFYLLGAFIVSFESNSVLDCFAVSGALLNNVGTVFSTGFTFTELSPLMHVLLSFIMLAGRLELYAVLLPFSRKKA